MDSMDSAAQTKGKPGLRTMKRLAAFLADDEAGGQKPLTHLTFLVNFFDELGRRAPVGK